MVSVLDLARTPASPGAWCPNDDALEALRQSYGRSLYSRSPATCATYAGLAVDVPVVGASNLLVVHRDMPEPLVYDITRLLFQRRGPTRRRASQAADPSGARASTGSPAPFDLGAIRYYRERGHWKD